MSLTSGSTLLFMGLSLEVTYLLLVTVETEDKKLLYLPHSN